MDKTTVFVKTKEGEEAMRQRTRLVQRNLRSILIMVDGKATVADLAKRFGDQNAAEAALTELLAGGFIVEPSGQLDFTSPQSTTAQQAQAEDVPVLTSEIAPSPIPTSGTSAEPPEIEEIELAAPEYESLPPPVRPVAPPKAAPPPAGPGLLERIKGLFAKAERPVAAKKQQEKAREEDYEEEPLGPDLAPIKRDGRLGLPVLALLAVVGIAVLLVLTLLLYPYGRHLPDIERSASAMLEDPVKAGDIGFSFLPRPHLSVRNVSVGKDEAHLHIGSVDVQPDFLSLLGDKKVFHALTFNNVEVKEAGLAKLARVAKASAPVEIRRLALKGVGLSLGDLRLDSLDGEVKLTPAGAVEAIHLHNAGGTLKLELRPQGEFYRIAVAGDNWRAPFKPNMLFQWLEAQGELRSTRLDLAKINGKAYEGLVEGKASLEWAGGARLAGDLELTRVSAAKLLDAFGTGLSAEGELSVRLKLTAKADNLAKLAEALHADGSFEMKRGAAKGFDLGEAVRSRGPTRGGETKFEQFSGTIEYEPSGSRLGSLRLASGLLSSGGSLDIAGNGQLSGAMVVELKSSAGTVRMPLSVGGTTKDAVLTPARR